MTNSSLEQVLQTFIGESTELLSEMEERLLALEGQPRDEEILNALFRTVHTIKGGAGIFGFEPVVDFAHIVENVLDRMRNGQVILARPLAELLLRCKDHLGALVDTVMKGDEASVELLRLGNDLKSRLNTYMGETGQPSAPATETLPYVPSGGRVAKRESATALPVEASANVQREEGRVANEAWHLSVRFGPDVLRHGLDPLSCLRYLATLGKVVSATAIWDTLPEPVAFDPETCYLGLEVDLKTSATKQAIADAFQFVRDEIRIRIIPPQAQVGEYLVALEEMTEGDPIRLGEMLVKTGALTTYELEETLRLQAERGRDETSPPRVGEVIVENSLAVPEVVEAALHRQQQRRDQAISVARHVRVDAGKLDRLIDLVGELVVVGASQGLTAKRLGDATLMESASVLSRLVEEIREVALRLRMVQIGETFSRFQRVVRDLARDLDKEVKLEVNGAETELDKAMVERLADPLTHLVRNSLDHGIERPSDRAAAGKPLQGQLALNAYHDSGSIVIEVADDGRGIDTKRVLAKAIQAGLVSHDAKPSETEILQLIFEPGLTTAAQVTDLSGRGVGMDVVRRAVEGLRGTIEVESILGVGTVVRVRLPLTLAIIDGFLVGIAGAFYVAPLDMVVECLDLTDAQGNQGRGYLNLRGEVLPLLWLRRTFATGEAETKVRQSVVVVQYGGRKAGLVVDQLLGEFQTVIKPLGEVFRRLSGISGATILGSGEVALILDVPALIQQAAVRTVTTA
ncbi:two-component system, chemotaxis family, sensor kinase CheA [Gammaproteobacteria bacterium]